jgi:hypothetical protein
LEERKEQGIPGLGGSWTLFLQEGWVLEESARPLMGAFGRGGILRSGEVVVRPYRRGGLVRYFSKTTYPGVRRFRNEFEIHAQLFHRGFPTVEPLGYAFRRRGLGWQGIYLTRWTEAAPWPSDWSRSSRILPALGQALGALNAMGYWAPDLNATNVLVTPAGDLRLIDWDRAILGRPGGLLPAYRARMARSLQKLHAPADVMVDFNALFDNADSLDTRITPP